MAFTDIVFDATRADGIWEIPPGTAPGAAVAAGVTMLDALRELWQLHGLDSGNPLVVSATSREVDAIEQTISGTDPVTVTRI